MSDEAVIKANEILGDAVDAILGDAVDAMFDLFPDEPFRHLAPILAGWATAAAIEGGVSMDLLFELMKGTYERGVPK
jgi:hypothetical protein